MAMGVAKEKVRRDYCLSSNDPDEVHAELHASGFIRIAPIASATGDLLIVRTGPRGLHVVILTDEGYVHADARLRRVVEAPGQVPWPVLSAWRHASVAAEDPFAHELVGDSRAVH